MRLFGLITSKGIRGMEFVTFLLKENVNIQQNLFVTVSLAFKMYFVRLLKPTFYLLPAHSRA